MSDISFKMIDSSHIPEIIKIARESFVTVWNEADFDFFITNPSACCIGLFNNDVLNSYFLGMLVLGDLDIVSIATSKNSRRQGFGRALLINVLQSSKIKRAFLEVDTTNEAAVLMYLNSGFEIIGKRLKYYEGKRDAFLMKRVC